MRDTAGGDVLNHYSLLRDGRPLGCPDMRSYDGPVPFSGSSVVFGHEQSV